jgi:acetyl-CoA/propionyl-CoA carboxylase biotin carboxyl carrier protein
MFDRILIANRGEIAVRIARTCRELGVAVVAVHSDVDARARHVALADESVHLPGVASADTYLDIAALIDAARRTGAEAVHPGYGFLAENADFADAVMKAGLVWIGPPPEALRIAGDKIRARNVAGQAGVPLVPGLLEPVDDVGVAGKFAAEHGYPVAIKAAGGGGGRGLKVAAAEDRLEGAFESARREARAYFGSESVYVERYLESPKHMEVQLLAPNPDEAMWLGVRDCSLQRRHQKLIEETPPPLFAERVEDMGHAAVALSKACGYANAGTVEFLVDGSGDFFFLEINARLQVEHTVTEEVYGIDLVACQLRVAAGEPLGFSQGDVEPRGHAIECRINAEDPARAFLPTPGQITSYLEPAGLGVRVDSGYVAGDEVPQAYDSLIAKLVAFGATRDEALRRMERALNEFHIEGIATTIPAHLALLAEKSFVAGSHTTGTLERSGVLDALVVTEPVETRTEDVLLIEGQAVRLWNPAMAPSAAAAVHGGVGAGGEVAAPMQGTIVKVLVAEGDAVEPGQALMVLEAMKMETTIAAPGAGSVAELRVADGDTVGTGEILAVLE